MKCVLSACWAVLGVALGVVFWLAAGAWALMPGLVVGPQSQVRATRLGISTQGDASPALFITGQGSWVLAQGAALHTQGYRSPAVLCSSGLCLEGARLRAELSPALVLSPEGGATLMRVDLQGRNPATVVMRSRRRDGADGPSLRLMMSRCTMPGFPGEPLFLVSNVQADMVLAEMSLGRCGSPLLQVGARSWGRAGRNGGNLFLRADLCQLNGAIEVDALSRADVILGPGTVWCGSFCGEGYTAVSLERGSFWQPGGACRVSTIDFGGREPREGVESILQVPGADVLYDPLYTPGLEGGSYPLPHGGRLRPAVE